MSLPTLLLALFDGVVLVLTEYNNIYINFLTVDVYRGILNFRLSGFIRNIRVFQVCVSTLHSLLDRVSGTESEGAL
jgi:hypothetical protein